MIKCTLAKNFHIEKMVIYKGVNKLCTRLSTDFVDNYPGNFLVKSIN